MKQKNILILEPPDSAWPLFLRGFFSDTPAKVLCLADKNAALSAFAKELPDMVFVAPEFLSLPLIQKMKVHQQTSPWFRAYLTGPVLSGKTDPVFSACFDRPSGIDFEKKWLETLPLPETARLLVIDDEEEIREMVRDYFKDRRSPAIEVSCASDGRAGLQKVSGGQIDVVVLDIKMPVMDGREFYAELKRRNIDIPVIVFFDSIAVEELLEIRRLGNPPVIEKGASSGALPGLMTSVKKAVYFGNRT